MAKYSVEWTNRAKRDLQNIYDFYSKFSTSGALKLITRIISREEQLESFPLSGRVEESLRDLEKGHRFLVEGNYKIIYHLEETIVYVHRVFNTRQDPQKLKIQPPGI